MGGRRRGRYLNDYFDAAVVSVTRPAASGESYPRVHSLAVSDNLEQQGSLASGYSR